MKSFLAVVQCRRDAAASRPLPTDDALATLELHGAVCQIGAEDNQLGSGTSHDEECVICFDAIAERLVLPCECRVSYCLGCWDRALAASFNSSGRARCPTCRTPVRVNFDPEAAGGRGRLVFSAENEGDESEERSDVVNRLAEQAAPLMTRLLRLHGETHPLLRPMARDPAGSLASRPVSHLKALLQHVGGDPAGCVVKADIIDRLLLRVGGAPQLAAECAALGLRPDSPDILELGGGSTNSLCLRCVCGGNMKRLSGRARCRQLISGIGQQLEPQQLEFWLDQLMRAGSRMVVCDLCDEHLSPDAPVYTCGNEDSTILHPTTYDCCESCYVRYAVEGREDNLATARR
jgi:hypothetical protein